MGGNGPFSFQSAKRHAKAFKPTLRGLKPGMYWTCHADASRHADVDHRQMSGDWKRTTNHDFFVIFSRTLAVAALGLALSAPAYAQTAQQPQTPARPAAPAVPAAPVAVPAKPAVAAPVAASPAQAQKVNLNTAAATDLDKLPQIGEARAKTIVENRTKNGRFKNWDDFVARKVVPTNAEAAIKDRVDFCW